VSSDKDGVQEARERLAQIHSQAQRLRESVESSFREAARLFENSVAEMQKARDLKSQLADLRAETTFLRLDRYLEEAVELEIPETSIDRFNRLWTEMKTAFQPVRPSREWLERIKEIDKKPLHPVLTPEECLELERRLKENVCPICVSYALDGTCTIQFFENCPIDTFLSRLVKMIDEMGHRPWMEDYFDKMYRDICPGCSGRVDEDYCPPREEGECSLFSYLPTIVKTVEGFLQEKRESEGD